MRRLFCIMLAMTVLIGIAHAATLENTQQFEGSGAGCGGGFLRAMVKLGLTDAQKHQVALILRTSREKGREHFDDFREALQVLRGVMTTNGSDENAVREAFKAVASAGEEMAVHKAGVIMELKSILTPEQMVIFEEWKATMAERRNTRMEVVRSLLDEWIEVYSK